MIRTQFAEGVATLTIDRPDAHNTIDLRTAEALATASADLGHAPDVRAVLIRSEGSQFCPGGDLRSFAAAADMARHLQDVAGAFHASLARITRLRVPVVAAVQGNAFGGGLALALTADIVIATENARFGTAYTAAGLSPDGGTTWILPRLIGLRRAIEMTLTNRSLTADEAIAWGLITEVVAERDLEPRSHAVARQLAQGATVALGESKALLWTSSTTSQDTQLQSEEHAMSRTAGTKDARAGIEAFLTKTKPSYSGIA